MKQVIFKNLKTVRELSKRVPFRAGGSILESFTTISDGREQVTYSVEMDHDSVAHMARRAAANKSGKCRDGALLVRVIRKDRI